MSGHERQELTLVYKALGRGSMVALTASIPTPRPETSEMDCAVDNPG